MRREQGVRQRPSPIWLFDLDDTLHNASRASMGELHVAMGEYIVRELGITPEQSNALRRQYWLRYGATLLGLMRHHGVQAAHFLDHTHRLPGLEQRVAGHRHDLDAVARLPGRKFLLTNAPRAYAQRVVGVLDIGHLFDGLIAIEDMHMFGDLRPKPDARMLRQLLAKLRVRASQCVLVEDSTVNLKAAHRVGMRTVWMRRWLPAGSQRRARRRPVYADLRLGCLRPLLGWSARWH